MVSYSPEALAAVGGPCATNTVLIGPAASTGTMAEAGRKERGSQGPRAPARVTPVRRLQRGAARRGGGGTTMAGGGGGNN